MAYGRYDYIHRRFCKNTFLYISAWPPRNGTENKVLKKEQPSEMHMFLKFLLGLNSRFTTASAYEFGLGFMMDRDHRIFIGHGGGLPGLVLIGGLCPNWVSVSSHLPILPYAGTGEINLKILDTIIRSAGLKPYSLPISDILQQRKMKL